MKSKTLGSICILSGTTIGAGLLALPLSSAGLGFLPTLCLLIVSYLITALSSLVILETLATIPDNKDLHFDSMCRLTLGRWGEFIFLLAYITLMYSITAAYLSGGSAIFKLMLDKIHIPAPDWLCSIVFTLILAGVVCKGARTTDFVNRYIMSVKGIIFVAILWLFLPVIKINFLTDMANNGPFFFIAVPIIFLIFGYQLIIPSLFIYLDKDIHEMKKTIFIGSFISLVIFILWLTVSLGSIPRMGKTSFFTFLTHHSSSDVALFFSMIGKTQPSDYAKPLLNIFANLALITSFLGITLSLKDYLSDTKLIRRVNNKASLSAALTFTPPLLLVIFKPALFQLALNYAAGMLVIVLLWLPCCMAIVSRRRIAAGKWQQAYQTPGGVFSFGLLILSGGVIFILSMAATMDLLPAFGHAQS